MKKFAHLGQLIVALYLLAFTTSAGAVQVHLKFTAVAGNVHRILFNPVAPNNRFWQDYIIVTNKQGQIDLSLPTTNGSSGFYRLVDTTGPAFWYDWRWYNQSNNFSIWGFGSNQVAYVHNDRSWDWYVDQANTGPDSAVNCGPAVAAMACHWFNQNSTVTALDARTTYPEGDGWWSTTDLANYWNLQGIPWNYYPATVAAITNSVAQGQLVILCLDLAYLSQATNSLQRVHGFGFSGTGHFVCLKGYRQSDGTLWFELYDPCDYGNTYADGTPKGRNRHYSVTEVMAAVINWWPYYMTVLPPTQQNVQTQAMVQQSSVAKSFSSLPVAMGK